MWARRYAKPEHYPVVSPAEPRGNSDEAPDSAAIARQKTLAQMEIVCDFAALDGAIHEIEAESYRGAEPGSRSRR